jgi:hypothetical protein
MSDFRYPTVVDVRRGDEEQHQSSGQNENPMTHFPNQST